MAAQKLSSQHDLVGNQAERISADELKLLEANYCCRFGEIDLVMSDSKTLVFVEVRLRSSNNFGGTAYSINTSKQKNSSLLLNITYNKMLQHQNWPAVLMRY